MTYADTFNQSIADPSAFWLDKAGLIDWDVAPAIGCATDARGIERWYPDGQMNTCFNAIDRHVRDGRGEQVAIYYDSPVTGIREAISYDDLKDRVARFAGGLASLGVSKGDRVVIYMPMVPETVVAMLACARLGAIHSVVFGGFAANELAVRLSDATPKVIVTATCGIEVSRVVEYLPIVNQALSMTEASINTVVVLERPQAPYAFQHRRDVSWADVAAGPAHECVTVMATDPLYILYTSGTTGKPKGVVRDNGGHAVALTWSMKAIYNCEAPDVFWAASDVGWVVGHSYIVYAPLLRGCSTVLYEGKPVRTPNAAAFWRVASDYSVKVLFAAPTAFRAIRKEDPDGTGWHQHDLSCLESLYLAGERLDPPTYHWLEGLTGLPIVDHWWQTETGWAIATNPRGIQAGVTSKPGSATFPAPGFNVEIMDASGVPMAANAQGAVVIKRPMPPASLTTIWGNHERFEASYLAAYPGYYLTGDGGYFDQDGYLFIMGRTDDVINVAGHRLSTGEMEEVVAAHPAVAECAVIGIVDELKGQVPIGFVVLKDGVAADALTLERELVAAVRTRIGALACFSRAMVVGRLPKTRSGKILRATMRKIADGEEFTTPSTIEDPSALVDIAALFER